MATKTPSAKMRGSDLLKYHYSEQDVEKLLAAGDADGITLVEFSPSEGPVPDPWGVWHVKRDMLVGLIDRLTKLERTPYFKVFPKGLPWPDMFEVTFETSPQRHR